MWLISISEACYFGRISLVVAVYKLIATVDFGSSINMGLWVVDRYAKRNRWANFNSQARLLCSFSHKYYYRRHESLFCPHSQLRIKYQGRWALYP